MAKYIMFGKYSIEGIKGIKKERTKKVMNIIEENGGKLEGMYVLLGDYDLVFIVEFPDNASVIKTSVNLAKSTGISFTSYLALSVEEFDKLVS